MAFPYIGVAFSGVWHIKRELEIDPGTSRALYGLGLSQLVPKTTEAAKIATQFNEAWKHADTKLSVATL